MTPTEQYFAGQRPWDKLSEDERNGVIAVLEGVKQDGGLWIYLNSYKELQAFPCAPDYLHDPELWAPLIRKYGISLTYCPRLEKTVDGTDNPIKDTSGDSLWDADVWVDKFKDGEMLVGGWGADPQAAICHAAGEIAKEKYNG